MIYPQPFGKVTAGSEKDYPVDFSHFNIQGSCVGAKGIEADSDKALFPAVDISTAVGAKGKEIKLKIPFMTGALGSTEIARVNWEGAAIASAICGSILVCGVNVCGMDVNAEIKNGKVVNSPELARRVKIFQEIYGPLYFFTFCNIRLWLFIVAPGLCKSGRQTLCHWDGTCRF